MSVCGKISPDETPEPAEQRFPWY